MSNTTTTKLAEDASAATAARIEAEAAKAAADAAYDQAQAAQADAEERLSSSGDIPQEEYDSAIFAAKRAAGAQHQATEALEQAIIAEQVAVATATAAELVAGKASAEEADKAVRTASNAVARAVAGVVKVTEHRNATIRGTIAQARAAGLVSGRADPFSPVLVTTRTPQHQPWRKGTPVLLVEGEEAAPRSPEDVVREAVNAALREAGLDLVVAGGAR